MSPELERLVAAYYRASQSHQRDVVAAVLRLWAAAGPSGFRDLLTQAAGIVAAGQLVAAVRAADYVAATAAAQDATAVDGRVAPRGFAGTTSAGRSLTDVLGAPVARSWALLESGADLGAANSSGAAMLTRIVGNEIAQSGTDAAAAAIVTRPELVGYIRVLQAPSCGRCAVLAGKWFRFNDGFDRHPGCDCVHVPATDRGSVADAVADPRAYYESLTPTDRRRYFGADVTDRIDAGADLTRTVNAAWKRPPRSRRTATATSRAAALRQLAERGLVAA